MLKWRSKVIVLAEFGQLRVKLGPGFGQTTRTKCVQDWTMPGQVWRAKLGRCRAKLGRLRAKFGRNWLVSRDFGPSLAELGSILAGVCPTSAEFEKLQGPCSGKLIEQSSITSEHVSSRCPTFRPAAPPLIGYANRAKQLGRKCRRLERRRGPRQIPKTQSIVGLVRHAFQCVNGVNPSVTLPQGLHPQMHQPWGHVGVTTLLGTEKSTGGVARIFAQRSAPLRQRLAKLGVGRMWPALAPRSRP